MVHSTLPQGAQSKNRWDELNGVRAWRAVVREQKRTCNLVWNRQEHGHVAGVGKEYCDEAVCGGRQQIVGKQGQVLSGNGMINIVFHRYQSHGCMGMVVQAEHCSSQRMSFTSLWICDQEQCCLDVHSFHSQNRSLWFKEERDR